MDTRKNILDLEYQKYLQNHTTTIIIVFTYVIGVIIALITKQVNINNNKQLFTIGTLSALIIGVSLIMLKKWKDQLKVITEKIKNL